jgi:hypothetical protein
MYAPRNVHVYILHLGDVNQSNLVQANFNSSDRQACLCVRQGGDAAIGFAVHKVG